MRLTTIWSHRPYSLYVMNLAAEATVSDFKKVFPKSSISYGVNYYEQGQNTYLYPEKAYNQTANALARQAVDKPAVFTRSLETAFRRAIKLNKYSQSFTTARIRSASNQKLINWVEDFSRLFSEMYAYGTVAILAGYSQDNVLYTTAEKILRRKLKGQAGRFSQLYVILTNQPRLGRNVKFELAIIKLAMRIKATCQTSLLDIRQRYQAEIKKLLKEYQWLSYDLCDGIAWDEKYIANLLVERAGQDLVKQSRDLSSYASRTQAMFKAVVKELTLNKKETGVFESIRNLGYYKWAREYEFTEALFRLKAVQDELARRLRISPLAIKYLLPSEYHLLLSGINKYRRELSQRIRRSLIISEFGRSARVVTGAQATKAWAELKPRDKTNAKISLIRGRIAYSGLVKGFVRTVNSVRHLSKVSVGDIMIAVTTSPALLPAMKKAAAIVTNEGGITSHAAIVSRELQIPCIVGAKDATRIFKDGDFVEVDAKHGLIKKIAYGKK
ncbi:MAG: PEP-utilizing enzyme [Patescibacteria group bacterium]